MDINTLFEKLKACGVGRRIIDDRFFIDMPPPKLGIHDDVDQDLCRDEIQTTCSVPGCVFTANTILDYENHYNSSHRYSCSQCKKVLPSPHLLDLHIQEQHDSFFAVMALKKPSYSCYVQDCAEKFMNAEERLNHCVKIHKLPKDFRFDIRQKKSKNKSPGDLEESKSDAKQFSFNNSKQRGFKSYSVKKFTNDKKKGTVSVNLDQVVTDLKDSLPSMEIE